MRAALVYIFVLACLTGCKAKAPAPVASRVPAPTGTWQLPCQDSVNGSESYTETTATFVMHTFEDADCRKPALEIRIVEDFRLGGAAPAVEGARELDFKVVAYTLKPLSAESAADLKTAEACGRKDWQAGREQSILGATCAEEQPLKAGAVILDIYRIDGNLLYHGYPAEGSKRAAVLDVGRPLTRVEGKL